MCLSHAMTVDQIYVDYYLNGIWPLCKCGCGTKVKWACVLKSFREYCHGHQSRIKNNWGHNPTAIANSSETRRQQYASGERKVWNDGLTKEMDERVKKKMEGVDRIQLILINWN